MAEISHSFRSSRNKEKSRPRNLRDYDPTRRTETRDQVPKDFDQHGLVWQIWHIHLFACIIYARNLIPG